MKTREDLMELIDNLDTTINRLEKDFETDNGGCCWVSYCISRCCEEKNINYKVVVYGYPGTNPKDVWGLAKDENMCHMSILLLGREVGGEIDKELVEKHNLTKAVVEMTSDEILKLYEENEFNGDYDKANNEEVMDEIEMTFNMVW